MGIEREVDTEVTLNLHRKLTDPTTSLPHKYRVLFSLRNISGSDAHKAMLEG